jgi:DNA methylase
MTSDLRLGDWRDVLPGSYDPARAVVITDPPFGLGGSDRGFVDDVPWGRHVADVVARLPAVRHVIRGPAPAIIGRDYPEARRLCVEMATFRHRLAFRPGVVPYRWLGWVVYGRLSVPDPVRKSIGDAMTIRPNSGDDLLEPGTDHHGLTPYDSAVWIVGTWAERGMVVVDPFAGSGTIGRAAGSFGLDYLGAELVPAWHGIASRSLRHVQPMLDL